MDLIAPEIWFPNLGIKIEKLSRVAFEVFGFKIYWYGVFIAFGVLAGILLATNEAKRTKQDENIYIDFAIFAIIACVIGARLYYVIFSWENYKDNLFLIFDFRSGGLAIYGGVITGIISALIYTKIKKINFYIFADSVAPSLLLGQIIGRWGNFFNREAFGGYTEGLFAMRYLKEQVDISHASILNNIITEYGQQYIQVHPTFLYESLWNLCVFILMMFLKRTKKFDGEIFGLYLIGYGLGRFWIEGLRTDQLLIGYTEIAISQVVSLLILIIGTVIMYKNWKTKKTINKID